MPLIFCRYSSISTAGALESILRGWRNSPLIPVKVTDKAAGVKQWDKEPVKSHSSICIVNTATYVKFFFTEHFTWTTFLENYWTKCFVLFLVLYAMWQHFVFIIFNKILVVFPQHGQTLRPISMTTDPTARMGTWRCSASRRTRLSVRLASDMLGI